MKNHKVRETDIWALLTSEDNELSNKVEKLKNSGEQDEELLLDLTRLHEISDNHKITDAQINKARQKMFDAIDHNTKTIPLWKHMLRYAAVVTIVCIGVFFAYKNSIDSSNGQLVTFETGFNEKRQIFLPDGSSVWMNASTHISYDSSSPRTLSLDGEAFFDVTKDKEHPFTVETLDNIKVTALGTSFNVRSYSNSTYSDIVLLTGSIEVLPKDFPEKAIVLPPNDMVRIVRENGELILKENINTSNLVSWKEGRITFTNRSFKEITDDLYLQQDIRFRFKNEVLPSLKFTGSFASDTPIREVLEVLKASSDFNFYQDTKTKEWVLE